MSHFHRFSRVFLIRSKYNRAWSNKAYRDMSIPYTEEEIQGLVEKFKKLPTFQNDAILSSDIPNLIEVIRYKRTPDQVAAYTKYWNEQGGKIGLKDLINFASVIHKTSLIARECAVKADTNQDGIISEDEFKSILEMISAHDPSISGKTFKDFVMEADTNKDGRVDIDECTSWIELNTTASK